MKAMVTWRRMIVTEGKLVWRDPAGVFLPLALPLLIIVTYGVSSGGDAIEAGSGLSVVSAIGLPTGFVTIVAILGLVNVPSFLAAYRKEGVLRRLAVTPARPSMVLASQIIVNIVLAAIGVVLAVVVVALSFELDAPREVGWTIVAAVLTVAAMYGVGLLIAALAPSSSAATALGLIVFLGTLSIGGGMIPVESLPGWLAETGGYLPFGAGVQALRDSWRGNAPDVADLAVLGATAAVASVLAVRFFRWQ
ncbi:MAG: ABC transporter permease [Kineosporiaceae bacterium]